jgi:hypothetical protein
MTVESLAQRLERVEQENHWLKILCLVPLVGLGAVVLIGATRAGKEEVRDKMLARKFMVVDKDNKERAILGVNDMSPGDSPPASLYWGQSGVNRTADHTWTPGLEVIVRAQTFLALADWSVGGACEECGREGSVFLFQV